MKIINFKKYIKYVKYTKYVKCNSENSDVIFLFDNHVLQNLALTFIRFTSPVSIVLFT